MFVSLSGLLKRLKGRSDQMYMVDEFINHYEQAKEAFTNKDYELLKDFFTTYTTSKD